MQGWMGERKWLGIEASPGSQQGVSSQSAIVSDDGTKSNEILVGNEKDMKRYSVNPLWVELFGNIWRQTPKKVVKSLLPALVCG